MVKVLKAMALAAAFCGLAACNGARNTAVDMLDKDSSGRGFVSKKSQKGRDYVVFVPKTYNPAKKYPMIVFLHGVGEGGTNDVKKPLSVGLAPFVADQVLAKGDFDFFVIFPQSGDGNWNENSEHTSDMIWMIQETQKQYAVDPDRVTLTGLSTGGYGSWAIGAKYSTMFAAIVPMGSNQACTDPNAVKTLAKMNVWAIENSGDPFGGFGANQRTVEAVNAAGGKALHTQYNEGGHNCWDRAYGSGELFAWMRVQSRSRMAVPSSVTPASTPAKSSTEAPIVTPTTPVSSAKPAAPATPAAKSSGNVESNGRAVLPATPY